MRQKRAEAVKELLIDTYKVSESQIKVVGLGYELDPFNRGQDIDGNGNFVESEAKKNRRGETYSNISATSHSNIEHNTSIVIL